jgi:multicomponent Na+:H+ antiporter subunit B
MKKIFTVLILIIVGAILISNLYYLPEKKDISETASGFYISNQVQRYSPLNIVTAILYDYRALDSLIEGTVIFAAVSGIVLTLSRKRKPVSSLGMTIIVKRTFGILTPFIFLFALYIILHGHLSPGGGFQGGVIMASISIIFSIVYGAAYDYKRFHPNIKTIIETSGALLFIGIGLLGVFIETYFLTNLGVFKANSGSLFSGGSIPLINIGIGFKIGAGFAIIFYTMIQKSFLEEE